MQTQDLEEKFENNVFQEIDFIAALGLVLQMSTWSRKGKGHPVAVLLGQQHGHHHHTGLCASFSHTVSRERGAVEKPITTTGSQSSS